MKRENKEAKREEHGEQNVEEEISGYYWLMR